MPISDALEDELYRQWQIHQHQRQPAQAFNDELAARLGELATLRKEREEQEKKHERQRSR